jgi:hypothetical protein
MIFTYTSTTDQREVANFQPEVVAETGERTNKPQNVENNFRVHLLPGESRDQVNYVSDAGDCVRNSTTRGTIVTRSMLTS